MIQPVKIIVPSRRSWVSGFRKSAAHIQRNYKCYQPYAYSVSRSARLRGGLTHSKLHIKGWGPGTRSFITLSGLYVCFRRDFFAAVLQAFSQRGGCVCVCVCVCDFTYLPCPLAASLYLLSISSSLPWSVHLHPPIGCPSWHGSILPYWSE